MRHLFSVILCLLTFPVLSFALNDEPADSIQEDLTPEELEMLEQIVTDSIHGQTGVIDFADAHCTLTVPEGFVYLNKEESKHLLIDYWGNPEIVTKEILGTLVSSDAGIYYNVEMAYVISYDDAGYVSDEDAEDIDYDDLLKTIRKDLKEEYDADPSAKKWELIGWAWEPNYDKNNKTLAWAKHFIIENDHEVINYDVRILGRSGYVIIRAVASPDDQQKLIANNDKIVSSIKYDAGYRYEDFNPETDHVAEWTIGGLIAGKVLAKAGVWAIIAKFGKVIAVAILAFIAAMRKRIAGFFNRRKRNEGTPKDESK